MPKVYVFIADQLNISVLHKLVTYRCHDKIRLTIVK